MAVVRSDVIPAQSVGGREAAGGTSGRCASTPHRDAPRRRTRRSSSVQLSAEPLRADPHQEAGDGGQGEEIRVDDDQTRSGLANAPQT